MIASLMYTTCCGFMAEKAQYIVYFLNLSLDSPILLCYTLIIEGGKTGVKAYHEEAKKNEREP